MLIKLLAVLGIVGTTSVGAFIPKPDTPKSALTPPANYSFKYSYNNGDGWGFSNNDDHIFYSPRYSRKADGSYYNYSHNTFLQNDVDGYDGLSISMDFNHSNVGYWGGDDITGWLPDSNSSFVGSDNSVGTISGKTKFNIFNNTCNDYRLYIDMSSSSGDISVKYQLSNFTLFSYGAINPSALTSVYIPSFNTALIELNATSAARYFNAFYLQDLGLSTSFDEGTDYGASSQFLIDSPYIVANQPFTLLDGVETIVGGFVNFALMIMSLQVFGISLLDLFLILVAILAVMWLVKAVRG